MRSEKTRVLICTGVLRTRCPYSVALRGFAENQVSRLPAAPTAAASKKGAKADGDELPRLAALALIISSI